MAESNLEVVLQLTSLFGSAAAQAAQDLNKVASEIDKLGAKKAIFEGLQKAANDLNSTLGSVSKQVQNLDGIVADLGVKTRQTQGNVQGATTTFEGMAKSAKAASDTVAGTTKAVNDLGSASSKVGEVSAEVKKVADITESARSAFLGLLGAIDQTQKGNLSPLTSAARNFEQAIARGRDEVKRLNQELAETYRIAAGGTRGFQLLGGTSSSDDSDRKRAEQIRADAAWHRQRAEEYHRNIPIDVAFGVYDPRPGGSLIDSRHGQQALPSGLIFESEFREIAAGFRRIQAEAKAAAAAAGQIGAFTIGDRKESLRNGINATPLPTDFGRNALVPYTFQGQAEDAPYRSPGDEVPNAKFRATRAGDYFNRGRDFNADFTDLNPPGFSGPSIDQLDQMDAAARQAAFERSSALWKSRLRRGDHMVSTGMAALVNGAILTGGMGGAFGGAMQTEQLDVQNEITARANGATGASAQFITQVAHQVAQRNGGNYADTVGSAAAFVGSMTPSANINDANWQRSIAYALNRASQVSVISTAGGAQIGASQTAVATNQAIANLGYDVSTPQKFGEAVKEVTNLLVKMKNVTPSSVPDTLSFLRAVGPVASLNHIAPEDMAGLIYALGKEKMVGSSAGNAVKRLFQRETLPAKRTLETQEAVKQIGGFDLSLYDKNGKSKSLVDVLDQVAQADKKGHWSDQTRAQVVGQLSGLYANAPVGALLQFMEKNGGKEGIRKQGTSIIHGGIAGSGKKDAVDAEFEQQQKSLANTVQVTTNKIREAWQGVFGDLEPTFAKIVKGIGDLADWFSRLPAPIKDGVVEIGLLTGVISLAYGAFNIFAGNAVKTVASLMEIKLGATVAADGTKEFVTVGQRLGGVLGGATKSVLSFVSSFVGTRIIAPLFSGIMIAVEAFAGVLGVSVGVAGGLIALLVGAVVGLAIAWNTNFLGMRTTIQGFAAGVGTHLAGMERAFAGWAEWVGKATEGIRKYILGLWDDFVHVISSIDNALGGWGHKALGAMQSLAGGLTHAAQTAGSGIHAGIAKGTQAASKELADLGRKFGDLEKGASGAIKPWITPSRGNTGKLTPPGGGSGAGAAPIDFGAFGNDGSNVGAPAGAGGVEDPRYRQAMDEIMNPSMHKKKKAKVTYDVDIHVGDIPADEIENAARKIEAKWATGKNKVHHKPSWLNLIDSSGNVAERTYGDPAAFRQATRELVPDKGLKQQVDQYLERVKYFRTGTEKELQQLEQYLAKAKTQGLKSYIEEQIAKVDAANLKKIGEATKQADKTHTALYGTDGTAKSPTGGLSQELANSTRNFDEAVQKADRDFREFQNSQKEGIPTAQSLKEKYNLLSNELNDLKTKHEALQQEADKAAASLKAQDDAVSALTGHDRASNEARKALIATANAERSIMNQTNQELANQQRVIDNVTASMNRANVAYEKAIEYQKTLGYAFQQAGVAAKQAVLNEGGNLVSGGLTDIVGRLTQSPHQNGISKLVSTYLDSYVQSVAAPIFKALIPGGGESNKPQQIVDTQGNAKLDTANGTLRSVDSTNKQILDTAKTIADNTKVFNGMQTNGDGSFPVQSVTQFAQAYQNDAGQADMSNASFGDWGDGSKSGQSLGDKINGLLNSKTAKTFKEIGGAIASEMAGMSQGGVAGGITAAAGIFASTGNPYVAAAGGIIAAFTHQDDPAKMPDKYDTQRYGTIEADLVGAGYNNKAQVGANGISFVQDNQTATATNNLGLIQYIQQWAAANVNNSDPSIAKQAQDDLAKWGTFNPNATSANDLISYDKNIGNEAIKGGTEKGTYTSIYNDATLAAQSIQQLGSASLTAAQNAKALADSFTANLIGGPSGFSIPYLGSVGGGNASSSFIPAGVTQTPLQATNGGQFGQSLPGGYNAGTPASVTIRILEGATVNSGQDVQQAIQDSLPMITNAVNQNNYNTARYMQGYQSQLS